MSIHEPVFDDSFAEPDFSDQVTWFVLPFVTVAKILRVAFGIRLNRNGGCATEIPTDDGVVVGGVVVGGVVVGGVVVGGAAVTFTVTLLQFTVPRLQVTVPLPARFRLVTRPPVPPELIEKNDDPVLDHVTDFVQSVTLASE
jgi:hypothetical protein